MHCDIERVCGSIYQQRLRFGQRLAPETARLLDAGGQRLDVRDDAPLLVEWRQGNFSGQESARNLSSFNRTRFVVPSDARWHKSTKSCVRLIHCRKPESRHEALTSKTGKSLLTTAPSNSAGAKPNAPLRASIRDKINWFGRTRSWRDAAISAPCTWPRRATPLPQSRTVTCAYS